jgi:hypothetical protein
VEHNQRAGVLRFAERTGVCDLRIQNGAHLEDPEDCKWE